MSQRDDRRFPPAGEFPRQQADPWAASTRQQPPPQPPYQPYQQPYAPQQPPRQRKSRKGIGIGCGLLGGLFVLVAILVSHSPSSPPAPVPAVPTVALSQPASTAAAAQQVTYVVTGSPADVTYGPAGSDYSGSVPMRVTKAIPSSVPAYYAVSAQLQGSGTVTCKIEVGGKIISQATATGGYQIAQCEIGQDPLTGQWQDDNAS